MTRDMEGGGRGMALLQQGETRSPEEASAEGNVMHISFELEADYDPPSPPLTLNPRRSHLVACPNARTPSLPPSLPLTQRRRLALTGSLGGR